jgi:hypothetical protein
MLEGPDVGYRFYATDPQVMCKVIRQVKQPCLAFKILGAGRRCANQPMVRKAFQFAFRHIKPTDGVIVGMYPRHFNQVGANTQYTRQLSRKGVRNLLSSSRYDKAPPQEHKGS